MDFLKAEIERKKRQMQDKNVMAGPSKKYFKRGDLAAKEKEEYLAKHAPSKEDLEKLQEIKQTKQESMSKREFLYRNRANFI